MWRSCFYFYYLFIIPALRFGTLLLSLLLHGGGVGDVCVESLFRFLSILESIFPSNFFSLTLLFIYFVILLSRVPLQTLRYKQSAYSGGQENPRYGTPAAVNLSLTKPTSL